jgi:DNA repair exonuclease SbcCD ATPase subunit
MFQSQTTETKLALLEEKLSVYEQMMKKIDSAIEKISETSQTISKMLAIHEERIEHVSKSDEVIIKMVEDIKSSNSEEHKKVIERVSEMEKTVGDLLKFRWQVAAISGAVILVVGLVVPFIDNMLGMPYNGGTEQTTKK